VGWASASDGFANVIFRRVNISLWLTKGDENPELSRDGNEAVGHCIKSITPGRCRLFFRRAVPDEPDHAGTGLLLRDVQVVIGAA
jgi:hypothetical protein